SAVNLYLAIETVTDMARNELLGPEISSEKAVYHFVKAVNKGLMKVFSKMGISTLQSYTGAQIFEAIGLNDEIVEHYFRGTPSRIGGVDISAIAREAKMRHEYAFRPLSMNEADLDVGGQYQFRRDGEYHLYNPQTISRLQHATRENSAEIFSE